MSIKPRKASKLAHTLQRPKNKGARGSIITGSVPDAPLLIRPEPHLAALLAARPDRHHKRLRLGAAAAHRASVPWTREVAERGCGPAEDQRVVTVRLPASVIDLALTVAPASTAPDWSFITAEFDPTGSWANTMVHIGTAPTENLCIAQPK